MDDGEQRTHICDVQLGGDSRPGKAIYSRSLRVLPDDWEPKEGVPRTRADCPVERPCPYVRCEWNLWMVDGRDRPGRRWKDGHRPSVVIAHVEQNCGADIADAVERGKLEPGAVPELAGLSDRQIRRIVEKAKRKLAGNPEAAHVLALMTKR